MYRLNSFKFIVAIFSYKHSHRGLMYQTCHGKINKNKHNKSKLKSFVH